LVYAKGNESPAHHTVRRASIEIICIALDLDQVPGQLLSQVRDLAQRIASSQLSSTTQL
jgi:hypothetical protein